MPRNLGLVIHSLAGGGAERVAARLASHWAAKENQVALITLDRAEADAYPVSERVQRVGLDLMRESRFGIDALWNNLVRIMRLRRAIRDCGASTVVSFTEKMNVTTLLAAKGLGVGVVIAERTDPRYHAVSRGWSWLRRRLYPRCQSLVVQTAAVRQWARAVVRSKPVFVIPNAAPPTSRAGGSQAQDAAPRIVALGRLSREKGFDLLVAAFAKIAAQFPQWCLVVYGTGSCQAELEVLREQLHLDERVVFRGWTSDTAQVLADADLFVLPSRYEGFPNALLEAMASGVACVSFDCESGPREILRDGVDGILVAPEDVTALACAMARVMSDASLRERLGRNARDVVERFSEARFYRNWDAVVEGISEAEFEQQDMLPIKKGI